MIRKIAAYALVLTLSVQALYNLGVTVFWLANREHIATTRCINRNRPELLCSGRCFLNSHLALDAEKSGPGTVHQPLSPLKNNNEISDYLPVFPGAFEHFLAVERSLLVVEGRSLMPRLLGCDIFHPPAAFA